MLIIDLPEPHTTKQIYSNANRKFEEESHVDNPLHSITFSL